MTYAPVRKFLWHIMIIINQSKFYWLVVLLWLTASSAALAGSNLVIPGHSIGGIYLREPASRALPALGKPSTGDAAMGRFWAVWVTHISKSHRQYELDVLTIRDQTGLLEFVEQVRVTSPWFITRQGVRVGSTRSTVLKVFPDARLIDSNSTTHVHQNLVLYDDTRHGILFEFAVDNRRCIPSTKCSAILIHPKGQSALEEYLPWYMADTSGMLHNDL
jgi:hypothetical protein